MAPVPMDAATRVAAARDQVSVEVEGEAVILSLADGVYYGLDPVGARVWQLMEQPRTVAELRDAVVAEWEVDAPTAERDLLVLLAELAARGLVEVRPAA
ncbi:MAG TPA: PqqD family protein [Longimicrobium sp.]